MNAEASALRGPLRKRESNLWQRDPHDFYVEPSWVSQRLFEEEKFTSDVHDPACGSGNIVRAAAAHGLFATGSDVVKRSPECTLLRDWLNDDHWDEDSPFTNLVSNPPFGLCDDRKAGTHPFVERCLERAIHKVALLLPANWVQGDKRSRWLETTPLRRVWFISPRPSMPPGDVLAAGAKPGNGTTDFAWFVWVKNYDGRPEIRWLRRNP